MQRISPVLVFRSVAVATTLALAGCASSADDASTTTGADEVEDASLTTESAATETTAEGATPTTAEDGTTTAADDETTTTEAPTDEPGDEIAMVCDAYLDSISFGTVEQGLQALTETLGPDAPSGVQEALDTLHNPAGDIEGYFAAQNTVDGYVLPICRDRFAALIVPAADDAAAAEAFVAAVRDGDLAAAETLAPTNVIAAFDWNGFPDATSTFSPENSTVNMLLEPTVTVFCQVANGAIEACAFGE